jgi:hypothetical protein
LTGLKTTLTGEHAEVLCVNRPRRTVRQRRRRRGADADRRVPKASVQDVRAVLRGLHPGLHDRPRSRQFIGAPGDVLAHFIAARAVQVAARAQALHRRLAIGADVFKVVLHRHRFAMALRGRFDPRVRVQGALAGAFAFLIDQAQHRCFDVREVRGGRGQGGVGAGEGSGLGAGRGAADSEADRQQGADGSQACGRQGQAGGREGAQRRAGAGARAGHACPIGRAVRSQQLCKRHHISLSSATGR